MGEPRENDLTAAFARNAPIRVLVIACLFAFAACDKVDNPALRLPPIKDCIAAPAFVCSRRARAAPVSITLIPNCLGALRLEALRLRTMLSRLRFSYLRLRGYPFTENTVSKKKTTFVIIAIIRATY